MRRFHGLYKKLMATLSEEVWQPSTVIELGNKRKKSDSGYCEYNPLINKFAMENSDNLAMVFAFVFYTIQTDWNMVVDNFPHFIKWFYTEAVKKKGNKLVVDRSAKPPGMGHMMTSPSKKYNGLASERLQNLYEVYDNRHKIYENFVKKIDNPRELFIYILKNIKGLAAVKAGFVVQLVTGRIGCMDSINSKVYTGDITGFNPSSKISKNKAGDFSPNTLKKIDQYIEYVDPLSQILWDDWCEIVESKLLYAILKPKKDEKERGEHKVIGTRFKDNDNVMTQTSYLLNKTKGNADSIGKHIGRLNQGKERGKVISGDHYNVLKDIEQYMRKESFDQEYEMLMREYVEDFDQKWTKAVDDSEELRVALDLMQQIKSKLKGEIYIVGGVPRDLLMGNAIDDVDLATNIPVEELEKHFELRNISKNDSQPVYAILWKGYVYDLAKFRTDSGDIGRQANVSTETDSFEKDSERRDLTINSFGLDENGKIVDYQGGLDDLKNKIVRAVGDAKKRFLEDATRILRVFRFAAKMDFEIEDKTKRAAIELKHLLQDPKAISKESISKEFYKSAKSGRTLANFLKKLQDTKILHDILPEFTEMEGFDHDPEHHPEGESQVLGHIYECLNASPYKDPVINLAVLFHDFGKATTRGRKDNGFSSYHGHEAAGVPIVERIFERLRFAELSQQDKKNILAAVDKHMLVHNIDKLNIKTLTKLIQNPAWETIKAVGYCDEASRGTGLFNEKEFWDKIKRAEEKVANIGGSEDETRKRLKQYFSGDKLMKWFPILVKDKSKFREITSALQEYTLEELNVGREPNEAEMKTIVSGILKGNQFNEWVAMFESSLRKNETHLPENPFAVFVVHQFPNGKIAATTRPKDRMKDDEGLSYGLPGGKVDPGEDPMEAAIRESKEEGWKVSGLTQKHSDIVQGKLVWWYHAKSATPLREYKEKYRGIKPIQIGMDQLKGFGNEIAIPKSLE
jgi:poly(A) polymerase/tRNA nucleotidyltransferase (CCA-adding enzyme)